MLIQIFDHKAMQQLVQQKQNQHYEPKLQW